MKFSMLGSAYRRGWSLLSMRGGEYSSTDTSRFDRFHLVEDPYQMGAPRELARFEATNRVIARTCPDLRNILEIASGEAIQTQYLARLTSKVTGVEVSARAVTRAQARMPDTEFIVAAAEDVVSAVGDRPVDLSVVCEMLYLTPNAGQIVADLQHISARIFVTNYAKRAPSVERHLTGTGWQRLENIEADGTVWWCHLWNRPDAD